MGAAGKGSPSLRVKQIFLFVLTYVAYTTLYGTRKPFSVVKKKMLENPGIPRLQLGTIEAAFLSCYALGQMLIPPIAQRYAEPKTVLFVSYTGSCIAAIGFSLCSTATPMIILFVFMGLFHASVYPLLVQSLAPWFDSSSRGAVFSTWTTSQQMGSLLASTFATAAAAKFGWRSVFLIPGIMVGIVGVILFVFLPKRSEAPNFGEEEEEEESVMAPVGGGLQPHHPSMMSVISHPLSHIRGIAGQNLEVPKSVRGSFSSIPITPRKSRRLTGRPGDGDIGRVSQISAVSTLNTTAAQPRRNLHNVSFSGVEAAAEAQKKNDPNVCDLSEVAVVREDGTAGSVKQEETTQNVSVCQVLRIPDMCNAAAAFFCVKYVRYALLFSLPMFLAERLEFSGESAGYCSTIFDVGGIPGAIFCGIVADRLLNGRRLLAALIMSAVTAVGILLLVVATRSGNPILVVSILGVVGFTLAGPDSALGAAAAQDICDRSDYGIRALAVAAGLVNGMGSSGAGIQAITTAYISGQFGWDIVLVTLSAILFIAVLCLLPTLRREAQSKVCLPLPAAPPSPDTPLVTTTAAPTSTYQSLNA